MSYLNSNPMHDQLAHIIWPVKPPRKSRDPNKPMHILALGLPRTGTDSLRTALHMLGYGPIWHGFEMPATRSNEPVVWTPLLRAKLRGDDQPARDFDWDVMLGDCEVLMDMPPTIFAEELLDYYPDAKVILSRRDLVAWHRSLWAASKDVFNSFLWAVHFFDAELAWWYEALVLCFKIMGKGEGKDFEKYGVEFAEEYYERVERKLKQDGRAYLNWEVKEGWKPLCDFLNKETPDCEFPWSNKSGEEFRKKADQASEKLVKRALAKMGAIVILLAISIAFLLRIF